MCNEAVQSRGRWPGIHKGVILYKPVLNLAVLSYFLRSKWSQIVGFASQPIARREPANSQPYELERDIRQARATSTFRGSCWLFSFSSWFWRINAWKCAGKHVFVFGSGKEIICMTQKLNLQSPTPGVWRRQQSKPRVNPPSSRLEHHNQKRRPVSRSWLLQVRVCDGNSKENKEIQSSRKKMKKRHGPWSHSKKLIFDVPSERCQTWAWPYAEWLPPHVVESQRWRASVIEPWSGWKRVSPELQRGTDITQKLSLIPYV